MIKFENFSIAYQDRLIIDSINLEINRNKITMILGKNGVGKSSLIKSLNGTIKYDGKIYINDKDLNEYSPNEKARIISLLPQKLKAVHITAYELLKFGRNPYLKLFEKLSKKDYKIIDDIVELLELEEYKFKYLDELSGGELQKIYLGMILVQDTDIIVLDEPTTYLDIDYTYSFLDTLNQIQKKFNKTIIIVMHDLNYAIEFADEIVVINTDKDVFSGTVEECLNKNIIEKNFSVDRYTVEDEIFFKSKKL